MWSCCSPWGSSRSSEGEGLFAAVLSIALTAGVGGWEIRVRGRPGGLGVSLLLTWLLAGVLVAIALKTGFL